MRHTPSKHHCNDLVKDISLLLDGELDRHTANALQAEIENCENCTAYYNSHSAFKKTVAQKVIRKSCVEDLKDSLRSRIRGL